MAVAKPASGAASSEAGALQIDNRFRILPGSALPDLGGLPSFAAQDRRGIAGEVVALRAAAGAPPRARLPQFLQIHHESLLPLVAHGAAGPSYWVISATPPGPSLATLAVPWSGNALLTHVLRPVALALDQLHMSGLTHRAIRPNNLFLSQGAKSVVLGPCCAAPPAAHQPACFEPAYSAICPPLARGEGSIADDVYALGVLLLALWTGTTPMGELDPREIIRRKLEYGSHAALIGQLRLQRGFEEILRAMLSDDPLSRPVPAVLANLDGIHARRGGQRSTLRATRAIAVGEQVAWNRRTLALLCAEQPAEALQLLRQGTIEQWLRRSAEDAAVAGTVEELKREVTLAERRPANGGPVAGGLAAGAKLGDTMLMRLVALLDPLAPLFWRGCWLWPDALGSMLAGTMAQPPLLPAAEATGLIEALVARSGAQRWRLMRTARPDQDLPVIAPRLLQGAGDQQSLLARLAYGLNPYLGCASPKLAAELAISPRSVLVVLERVGGTPLLDLHVLAFLIARLDNPPSDLLDGSAEDPGLRELSILARCQRATEAGPLPRIAANLLPRVESILQDWPGLSRRERHREALRAAAVAGDLSTMIALLGDNGERKRDEAARELAVQEVSDISATLTEQARSMPARLELSRHAARDTASAAGLLAVMAVVLLELLR